MATCDHCGRKTLSLRKCTICSAPLCRKCRYEYTTGLESNYFCRSDLVDHVLNAAPIEQLRSIRDSKWNTDTSVNDGKLVEISGTGIRSLIEHAIQAHEQAQESAAHAATEHERAKRLALARNYERARNFEQAAAIYEECGLWDAAGRVRAQHQQTRARAHTQITANKIHIGDVVDSSTTISDSVVQRSTIGTWKKAEDRSETSDTNRQH